MSDDEFVPWSERADDDNVDDFIAMMADAVNHQVSSDLVGNIVADAVQSRGENVGILGNFLLVTYLSRLATPFINGSQPMKPTDGLISAC